MWGKLHKNMAAVKIFSNSPFTTGEDSVILYEHSKNAPVVQWIERQIPVLNVGGSSPSGRTTNSRKELIFMNFLREFFLCPANVPHSSLSSIFTQHDQA